eukprot:gnl/TRDRNA2_/TRDRNA2_181584_c0_seq1.p1 gnl/TRDRNA2_/TRDRNA2_181584_c0~~gnl/TRDRNA2_/TRDRNA2_181584_c0_seq1.p1  ORF type:complete len:518 (+),score=101.52 gnl/TRDRNA2_/TRDRNA2_181584_c0_seq1:228-1556(+)
MLVIVINAFWIGIDTEWNNESSRPCDECPLPLQPTSDVIENLFCAYFTVEIVIRTFAKDFAKEETRSWFVFDGVLVTMMVIETWVLAFIALVTGQEGGGGLAALNSLRLLRLMRLARMGRLMRHFPEMLTLIKGIASAAKAVAVIIMFILLVMYVFAIVFTAQLAHSPFEEAQFRFGSIGSSMMTLFTQGVLWDNLPDIMIAIKEDETKLPLMWVFVVFLVICSITLLNMLIGVLCQVVGEVSADEEEQAKMAQLKDDIRKAFDMLDTSLDGFISEAEWKAMRTQEPMQQAMKDLGVSEMDMNDVWEKMQQVIFRPVDVQLEDPAEAEKRSQGLAFKEFVETMIELRPASDANALDVEMLRTSLESESRQVTKNLCQIEAVVKQIAAKRMRAKKVKAANTGLTTAPAKEDPESIRRLLQKVPSDILFHALKIRQLPLGAREK